MVAYRRVYNSRHLQADCQEPGSASELYTGNRVWTALFTLTLPKTLLTSTFWSSFGVFMQLAYQPDETFY